MEKESEPRLYEIIYLARSGDEQGAAEQAAAVSGFIENEHGMIVSQTPPSRKELSYPVDDLKEGWFGWIKFMLKPESIAAVEEKIKKTKNVLRFAVFKTSKAEMAPAPRRKRKIVQTPVQKSDIAEIDKKLEEMLGK